MACEQGGKTRYFYTGNQVGDLNPVGDFNFVSGGIIGQGISAGAITGVFFADSPNRRPWVTGQYPLSQELLDASFPYINLQWICDIHVNSETILRVSNRNIYVEEENGPPRFYEARCARAPRINITSGEWLSPNFEIGDMKITLNNRDGYFNQFLAHGENYIQWQGNKVVVKVGFGEKISNYHTVFEGFVAQKRGMTTTDKEVIVHCYDRFDRDDVPIPARAYDEILSPDVERNFKGKVIPLVYGDWTTEVGDYGAIPAACSNANDDTTDLFIWKIADNELSEIGDVYLHRGKRVEGDEGPIKLLDAALIKDLENGRILIDSTVVSLSEEYPILREKKAGAGTNSGTIFSDSPELDFVNARIKAGDVVVKIEANKAILERDGVRYLYKIGGLRGNDYQIELVLGAPAPGSETVLQSTNKVTFTIHASSTSQHIVDAYEAYVNAEKPIDIDVALIGSGAEVQSSLTPTNLEKGSDAFAQATVLSVLPGQLSIQPVVTFKEGDTYNILTDKYVYLSGDKLSVFCKGKDITTMSRFRISDAQAGITPTGISAGLDNTFWTADNETKKIYEISFDKEIVREIDYSTIDPLITEINGITLQTDGTLWLFDVPTSTIYRILGDGSVGLSFSTLTVSGIAANLTSGAGLTINEGNLLTIVDNFTGDFYVINPFFGTGPLVVATFNISVFQPLATEIMDISADVNANELVVVDRQTNTVFRIDPLTGSLNSAFVIDTNVESGFVNPFGVSSAQDGTIYLLNRSNNTVYNFNEFTDANNNPGFIARDILQNFSGRTSYDFDLTWNQTCRETLGQYRARLYINDKSQAVQFIVKFLQEFNTMVYNRFQKYSLFAIDFDNFRTDGSIIREGDIIANSFKPNKEYNQYFNSAQCEYGKNFFNDDKIQSDIYVSPLGVQLAGKEVARTLSMPSVYRRDDVDQLLPLFVKLSAAEPEFVTMTLGLRFLFIQIADFFNINFYDLNCETNIIQSGRRFNNIPSFVRSIMIDLDRLAFEIKLWSLGTTQFGNFTPEGVTAGGEYDDIVLTNLGTPGYISPHGYITGSGVNYVNLEDVDAVNAENRTDPLVGQAWKPSYKVALVDASDHSVVEILTIESVVGDQVNFIEDIATIVGNTVKNSAGFSESGHYLRYANYDEVTAAQKTYYSYFGNPEEGYPVSSTIEVEEQRAGQHNFYDGRVPYLLHPIDFTS